MSDENPYSAPTDRPDPDPGPSGDHEDFALRRLIRGVSPNFVRAELVSRGLSEAEARAVLKRARRVFEEDGSVGVVGRLVEVGCLISGYACLLIGGALMVGNLTGLFPTVPYAGTVVIVLGLCLAGLGGGLSPHLGGGSGRDW